MKRKAYICQDYFDKTDSVWLLKTIVGYETKFLLKGTKDQMLQFLAVFLIQGWEVFINDGKEYDSDE